MMYKVLAAATVCTTIMTGCVSTSTHTKTLGELEATQQELARTQASRSEAERQMAKLQEEQQQLTQLSGDIRRERDLLQTQVEDRERRLATAEQALASGKQALADAHARIGEFEQAHAQAKTF